MMGPSCAWPEPRRHQSDEHLFCENGSKAFAWEATIRRCTPEFFAARTVAELTNWGDYELELEGRLTPRSGCTPRLERPKIYLIPSASRRSGCQPDEAAHGDDREDRAEE